jgi:hypothetical protein
MGWQMENPNSYRTMRSKIHKTGSRGLNKGNMKTALIRIENELILLLNKAEVNQDGVAALFTELHERAGISK